MVVVMVALLLVVILLGVGIWRSIQRYEAVEWDKVSDFGDIDAEWADYIEKLDGRS